MCGFSGLPKFRQLVSPSGSAPAHARLAAHSITASTAPRYGSQATRRPLPSMETAMPGRGTVRRRRSSASTAASHASGRRTVREPTSQSYWEKAQRREARLAEPSSPGRTSASSVASSVRGGAGYSGVVGAAGSRS